MDDQPHVAITLADEERRLLLDQVAPFATVGEDIAVLLRLPGQLTLALDEDECELLLEDIASAAGHAKTRRTALALMALLDRLEEAIAASRPAHGSTVCADPEPRYTSILNSEQWSLLVRDILPGIGLDTSHLPRRGSPLTVRFAMPAHLHAAALDAINMAVAAVSDPGERRALDSLYGALEAAELGDSPAPRGADDGDSGRSDDPTEALHALLWALRSCDWRDVSAPFHLDCAELALQDLAGARFFHNCRELMRLLVEEGGIGRTPQGNLPRSAVAAMMARGRWDEWNLSYLSAHKVVNERDLDDLLLARELCEVTGVVRKYRGKFIVPKKHQPLVVDDWAGALYAVLFETAFRRCDLAALDGYDTLRCSGPETPYMLLALWSRPAEWATPLEMSRTIMVPPHGPPRSPSAPDSQLGHVLYCRFLRPLEWFGLVERRAGEGSDGLWTDHREYRKTELYDRFIRVDPAVSARLFGERS